MLDAVQSADVLHTRRLRLRSWYQRNCTDISTCHVRAAMARYINKRVIGLFSVVGLLVRVTCALQGTGRFLIVICRQVWCLVASSNIIKVCNLWRIYTAYRTRRLANEAEGLKMLLGCGAGTGFFPLTSHWKATDRRWLGAVGKLQSQGLKIDRWYILRVRTTDTMHTVNYWISHWPITAVALNIWPDVYTRVSPWMVCEETCVRPMNPNQSLHGWEMSVLSGRISQLPVYSLYSRWSIFNGGKLTN